MEEINVLLAGESWVSSITHFKGWDFFSSTVYETGEKYLKNALSYPGIKLDHIPSHVAAEHFPSKMDELNEYDIVILSDIGANTLLLHPDTWVRGKPTINRLKLLVEWVKKGGGLVMCGGYYSFAGIYGAAKYYRSPIEEILPVNLYTFDDRVETPEGAIPEIVEPSHPIVAGIESKWPALLGFNELIMKKSAELIVKILDYPLLAAMNVENGRTLAWASDIGPHWCPEPFANWAGYATLWVNSVKWLCRKN